MKIPTTLDRKMKKLRLFTFALAVWLLIAALPISAFAELLELETQPMEDQTVYVLAEDTTKRNEFEKHYYCSDGTFVAVTYPEAVHYKDENGEWVDVDMRLASDASAASYEGQSGDFKTVFSTPCTGGDASVMTNDVSAVTPAVSIQSGEYTLSWSLTGTKAAESAGTSTYALTSTADGGETIMSASADTQIQVLGEIKTTEAALSVQKIPVTDPDAFALPAVSNQVMYEDVFGTEQNVSVRYSVSLNKIEEDILITAPTEMTSFSMQVACGELTPVLNDDNSVDFVDELGNMVYHVSIPYLADAAFAVSYDVAVTLTQQDGVCTITYTPDAEWMNAPEREYPIMLDPAVTTQNYDYAISDTHVVEGDDTWYYTNQYLDINQSTGVRKAAIFRFNDLPQIEPGMPIHSATFKLSSFQTLSPIVLKLDSLNQGFDLLMDNYDDWNAMLKNRIDTVTFPTGTSTFTFDMSTCITDMYDGVIGREFSVALADPYSTSYVPSIVSMDSNLSGSLKPCLIIEYGYELTDDLSIGVGLLIQSASSDGYLYPNSGLIGDGSLVLHAPATIPTQNRRFTLKQNTATGGYQFEYNLYTDNSGVCVSANTLTNRVQMQGSTNVPTNISREWLIIPVGTSTFKIALASDTRYVMTAVGEKADYIANPDSATGGYVSITKCTGTPTEAQLWHIYKNGALVYNHAKEILVDNGTYYLNHDDTGMFLRSSGSQVDTTRGRVDGLGISIAWRITWINGDFYILQNPADTTKALTDNRLSGVSMTQIGTTYSDAQKWTFSQTAYGYVLINEGTHRTLKIGTGTDDWDLIKCTEYVELNPNVAFSSFAIALGETAQATTVTPIPSNTTYASLTKDFIYTSSNTNIVSVNQETGEFCGENRGTVQISVMHKITGITKTFDVTVEKKAFIIIPGFGGSVLQMTWEYPFYNEYENKDVFSFGRIELIEQGGVEAINEVNELFTSFEDGQVVTGIYNYIQQFINESDNTEYNDAIESLMLLSSMNCDDFGGSSSPISPKVFNAKEPYNSDKYGFGNVYQTLYENLLTLTQEQNGQYKGYEVTIFTYDWRLSCATAATQLNSFIENNQYDSVVLICHSTGGIVGSAYLTIGNEQQSTVEKYISYGTPHLGTTISSLVCLSGDINLFYKLFDFENEWINIAAKELIRQIFIRFMVSNYSSVYELFPNQHFFNYNQGYIYECNENSRISGPYDYDGTKNFISTHMKGYNPFLMEKAEELHNQISPAGNHVTYLVDSTYVFSSDFENPVSASHECNNALIPSLCNATYTIESDSVGDTVVHYRSATIGGARNLPRCYEVHETHMDMLDLEYSDFYNLVNYQGGTS